MDKPSLSVWFCDLFPRCEAFFRWLLPMHFNVTYDSSNPDLVFYSDFGESFVNYPKHKRIYYTGENIRPNFDECQFALTFDRINDPRHLRLPLYVLEHHSRLFEYKSISDWDVLIKPKPPAQEILKSKTKFCNFIVSNPNCDIRNEFFRLLNQYKKVDSAGSHLNNMGTTLPKEPHLFYSSKLAFQKDYKFSITFENSNYPGYCTEKILDPMYSYSLPIYWGDPLVHLDFNPKSFINAAAFRSLDELVQWVIKVDQYDELYCKYAEQPYLTENKQTEFWDLKRLNNFIESCSKQAQSL